MRLLLLLVILSVFVSSCARPRSEVGDTARVCNKQEVSDLTRRAGEWADSVADAMTLEEQVGQLFMPASYTRTDNATISAVSAYVADCKVGGMVFLKGDTCYMRVLSDTLQRQSRVPMFLAVDAEWGLGMRLEGARSYPKNYRLADAGEQWMYDYGYSVGCECLSVGLNMVLGPVLDVAPAPGTVMYKRSLGADPAVVGRLGTAYARGLEDAGVVPVAKHFPGHGFTWSDSHDGLPVIRRDSAHIAAVDLLPFRQYIDMGFPALMAGHISMPALSGDTLPAVLSRKVMTGILRGKMKFDGLLITDALNMKALDAGDGTETRAVRTLMAGADIMLAPSDTRREIDGVVEAVRSGRLSASIVRDRCRRVLFYKFLTLMR